jgi:hypothetical protein
MNQKVNDSKNDQIFFYQLRCGFLDITPEQGWENSDKIEFNPESGFCKNAELIQNPNPM